MNPKDYLVLIVYDRYQNLHRWLQCWKTIERHDFDLVVIHNDNGESTRFKALCDEHGVNYILRPNIGYDIGAFQDVCKERLEGFDNNWNRIIWVADDWYPMAKNLIKQFVNHYEPTRIGAVCTEISHEVKAHIRTSGFMIDKRMSKLLTFDADPVASKQDCFNFEHASPNAFFEQVVRTGLAVHQICPLQQSPLWDTHNRAFLNRMDEHNEVFYSSKKVAIICPIYKCYPQIVSAMINQTHQDWHLFLTHDGEADQFLRDYIKLVNDPRITFRETETRGGNYGHYLRQEYLEKLKTSDFDFVMITNGDNYHTPNCLENLIKGFDPNTIATFGDSMTHSYFGWGVIYCKPERGFIDCASVLIRKDIACSIGWRDIVGHSSDWTFFEDIANVHGWHRFKKVYGNLLIHN